MYTITAALADSTQPARDSVALVMLAAFVVFVLFAIAGAMATLLRAVVALLPPLIAMGKLLVGVLVVLGLLVALMITGSRGAEVAAVPPAPPPAATITR